MATYYVDPAAGGGDTGVDWTNAWTTLQRAIDGTGGTQPSAGDTVYCRGSETLTTAVTWDGLSGDGTTGLIKWIGCAADGSVDGTRFTLNGNSAAANCVATATASYQYIENFVFTGATGDGVALNSGGDYYSFVNCLIHTNASDGIFYNNASIRCFHWRCQFYNNTLRALYKPRENFYGLCVFYGNGHITSEAVNYINTFYGCVFHDNDDSNPVVQGDGTQMYNCVLDGTGAAADTGVLTTGSTVLNVFVGNRITNLTTGLDFAGDIAHYGYNYFHGNTADTANAGIVMTIPEGSTADTNQADVDADDGYNDVASNDFNIKASRTLRRQAISLQFGS